MLYRLLFTNPHTHVLMGFGSFIVLSMCSLNNFLPEVPSGSRRELVVPGDVNQKLQV